jgi:hypothetical protein
MYREDQIKDQIQRQKGRFKAMFGTVSSRRGSVLGVLFVLAALALMAFGAASGQAAGLGGGPQATESQELEATINSQISWGSANGCEQNIKTNNFGNLVPSTTEDHLGSFDALPGSEASKDESGHSVWVGCVTTNTTLASVEAAGTNNMSDVQGTLLPLSDVGIGITNAVGGEINGGKAGCSVTADQSGAGACTLSTGGGGQTLVTEAGEGTTELDWQYQLNLPANQEVGSYSGGEVTFTATGGELPEPPPAAS